MSVRTLVLPFLLALAGACSASVSTESKSGKTAAPATPDDDAVAEPDTEPPPAPKRSKVRIKDDSVRAGNIVFHTGKAALKEGTGSEKVLEQLKLFLDENPEITKLRIEGHTDNVGKEEANLELSGQRALTIKRWLIDHGISANRLLAVGFGETKPIARNDDPIGRGQNRRTELKIAERNGKPYLGRDPTGGGKVFE